MKLKSIASILIITFLSISTLALSIMLYARYLYPDADYIQIALTVMTLSPDVIKTNISLTDYILGLSFFIIVWPLCYLFLTPSKQLIAATLMGLGALYLTEWPEYMILSNTDTTLYEEYYVYPDSNITAPKSKRNLILIYLESFEQNYTLAEHYNTNLIPHINALQTNNNHSEEYRSFRGVQYSIAALVATHCGIPLFFLDNHDMYARTFFLPGAVCFPEILKENNYQTEIIKVADIHFTDTDKFVLNHGYEKALGKDQILAKYSEFSAPQYQGTFNGLTDRALYEVAKKELAEFSPDKPFFLTLFSLDTHIPGYHLDKACATPYHDIRDAYMCSDIAVNDFISWLKTSPYWENTTVVILGDHPLPNRIKTKKHIKHKIFNVFLNLPDSKKIDNKKIFSALDIPATLLESINFNLKDHSYGLGRSIFTDVPSLLEKLGNNLNRHLLQHSEVYDKLSAPKHQHIDKYVPYTLGKPLDNQSSIRYTDVFEDVLGQYYLDRLNLEFQDSLPSTATTFKVHIKFNGLFRPHGVLSIMANNTEAFSFKPEKGAVPPYTLDFTVPSKLVTDNKLQLKFHNSSDVRRITTLGIAPLEIRITAE